MTDFYFCVLRNHLQNRKKISEVFFTSKLQPSDCTQISNSDEDRLWNFANNSINYRSNGLKKISKVVQSTNKKSSEFKNYPLNCPLSKKNPENHLTFSLLRQVTPLSIQSP